MQRLLIVFVFLVVHWLGSVHSYITFNWIWDTMCLPILSIRSNKLIRFHIYFVFLGAIFYICFLFIHFKIFTLYLLCRVPHIEDYGVQWSVLSPCILTQIPEDIMLVSSKFLLGAKHFIASNYGGFYADQTCKLLFFMLLYFHCSFLPKWIENSLLICIMDSKGYLLQILRIFFF